MGNQRLEIVGVRGNREISWLKSLGCFTEIINWQMRVFIPNGTEAISVIKAICAN
jgi:hypothetical protein